MLVVYNGAHPEVVVDEWDNGSTVITAGQPVDIPDDLAARLIEQDTWSLVQNPADAKAAADKAQAEADAAKAAQELAQANAEAQKPAQDPVASSGQSSGSTVTTGPALPGTDTTKVGS